MSDAPVDDAQQRLEAIVDTIEAFAQLRFDERAPVGLDGDVIDAIAAGVNFLGEELAASFAEIESRVAERTAELTAATQALARQSLHDPLTGLPNRTLFWDRLTQRLDAADRRETPFAVLFLDIDGFKAVNDALGHAAGDQLLVDASIRIRSALRAGDSAARVGGDEFLVLLDEVDSPRSAMAIAERMRTVLGPPYRLGSQSRHLPMSIGVCVSAGAATSADALVRAADAAMYQAKRSGGNRCEIVGGG